tara:strand:- start:14535 stop:14651 length:117 start_codon:yes stop_codon:yes gene_type:complete
MEADYIHPSIFNKIPLKKCSFMHRIKEISPNPMGFSSI